MPIELIAQRILELDESQLITFLQNVDSENPEAYQLFVQQLEDL
jgi:hypothetical protein